jgi:hypothetical protein
MEELNEIEKGQLCQSTIEALYDATGGFRHFPGLLKKIIATKAWERRVNKGKVIELKSLRELITEKPIRGWGEDSRVIESVIRDDAECLVMYREAMKEQGNHLPKSKEHNCNNVTVMCDGDKTITGNSKAYTCERLSKVAPELFEEVKAGRISANAAAIKAGIRKKPTPEEACVKAFSKSSDRLVVMRELVSKLSEHEAMVVIDWLKDVQERNGQHSQRTATTEGTYMDAR